MASCANSTISTGLLDPDSPLDPEQASNSNDDDVQNSSSSIAFCGDGIIDPGESCDSDNLQETTCSSLGLGTGVLTCTSACSFYTSNCELNLPAQMILFEGFEEGGWENSFRSGTENVDLTTNAPHSGQHALRGNLMQDRVDEINGVIGEGNPQLEFDGNNLSTQTPNEVFIRLWMRLDHSTWLPLLGGKTFYITDDHFGTASYYFSSDMDSNEGSLSDNGAWFDWCVENWGYQKAYLINEENDPVGPDGLWHKIEVYANYVHDYIVFWVDGNQLVGHGSRLNFYPDGKIPLHPDFHLRGLQFLYVHDQNLVDSIDLTGYAGGYQFDDIEVWNGLPPGMTVVTN